MTTRKRVLITGGSSGIGYQSVVQLLAEGIEVIFPCRDKTTSKETMEKLKNELTIPSENLIYASSPIMDLSDLNSIQDFVNKFLSEYEFIDILILNAGLQYTGSPLPKRSKQGFELTFAVNHLSHHYLTYLLLPLVLKSKYPRIIITSSEVHNPFSPGGRIGKPAGLADMKGLSAGKDFSIIDGISSFSADKAYKDSKLCNILFAKELSERINKISYDIPILAWAPGLIIPRNSNGFFRYSRKYNALGQIIFAFFARDLFRITESANRAGEILKMLALSEKYNIPGFSYYSNIISGYSKKKFVESLISEEASEIKKAKNLWYFTSKLLKIDTSIKSRV